MGMWRLAPVVLLTLFAGCSNNNPEVQRLSSQVAQLKAQLGQVEKQTESLKAQLEEVKSKADSADLDREVRSWEKIAYLTPGADGYAVVRYAMGFLTVSLENVAPYANGSRITIKIGNPSAADVSGLKFKVDWGEVSDGGTPLNAKAKTKEFSTLHDLKAGSWTKVQMVLEGVPPSALGFVRLSDIAHKGIQLRVT